MALFGAIPSTKTGVTYHQLLHPEQIWELSDTIV